MIDFIENIAKEAGELIMSVQKKKTRYKGSLGDVVTEADFESEKLIISKIKKAYPKDEILAEEEFSGNDKNNLKGNLWVIDPLDGTSNYSTGIPFFCVAIAFVQDGKVKSAGVYDPNRDEIFTAEVGRGAFLNGKKIIVDPDVSFKGKLVDVGSPFKADDFRISNRATKEFHALGARIVNFGSASLEFCYVASGRLALYYEIVLKPWDVAAGQLIVKEAGGVVIGTRNYLSVDPREVITGNKARVKVVQKMLKAKEILDSRFRQPRLASLGGRE